jgi:hypothetical protein
MVERVQPRMAARALRGRGWRDAGNEGIREGEVAG